MPINPDILMKIDPAGEQRKRFAADQAAQQMMEYTAQQKIHGQQLQQQQQDEQNFRQRLQQGGPPSGDPHEFLSRMMDASIAVGNPDIMGKVGGLINTNLNAQSLQNERDQKVRMMQYQDLGSMLESVATMAEENNLEPNAWRAMMKPKLDEAKSRGLISDAEHQMAMTTTDPSNLHNFANRFIPAIAQRREADRQQNFDERMQITKDRLASYRKNVDSAVETRRAQLNLGQQRLENQREINLLGPSRLPSATVPGNAPGTTTPTPKDITNEGIKELETLKISDPSLAASIDAEIAKRSNDATSKLTSAELTQPASGKKGDEYLNTLSPSAASAVKGIGDYDLAPPGGQRGARIMGMVKQYNHDYDATRYQAKQRTLTSFSVGKQGDTMRSMEVLGHHLNVAQDAFNALENNDLPRANQIINRWNQETGKGAPVSFDGVKIILGDELVKAIIGGVNALGDRQDVQATLSRNNSPEAMRETIGRYKQLVRGQIEGLKSQYERGTMAKDFDQKFAASLAPFGGSSGPKVGEVRKGYKFKGGDPSSQSSWEKVQ